jgi:hypothetical protein
LNSDEEDPAVPKLVYTSFSVAAAGFVLTFAIPHRPRRARGP